MHRKRLLRISAVLVVASAGLGAWLLGVATGTASAHPLRHSAAGATAGGVRAARPAVTVVKVTAGKPAELGFTLSRFSNLPVGTVTFKVTNAGGLSHDFEVCALASTKSLNACKGTKTASIAPGKSATLTVKFTKKGQYEFLCTVPGHARAGMKGFVGIGVKLGTGTGTTGTSVGSTSTSQYSNLKPCASPVATTVQVSMFEYSYTISPASFPCGTVTFVMKNTGQIEHNFNVLNVQGGGAGNVVGPGETTTKTMTLGPGGYSYQCDVEGHLALGMVGNFTVSG